MDEAGIVLDHLVSSDLFQRNAHDAPQKKEAEDGEEDSERDGEIVPCHESTYDIEDGDVSAVARSMRGSVSCCGRSEQG